MRIFAFFSMLFLLASCSHRIVRTGYQVSKSDYTNCPVTITRSMQITDSVIKVGEIKLGETGFSVACSEAHALEILKNEACALQADFINITEEKRPDLLSTCYRCKAEFYKFNNPNKSIATAAIYDPQNVDSRVTKDRTQNTVAIILGVTVGIIVGFLLVQ